MTSFRSLIRALSAAALLLSAGAQAARTPRAASARAAETTSAKPTGDAVLAGAQALREDSPSEAELSPYEVARRTNELRHSPDCGGQALEAHNVQAQALKSKDGAVKQPDEARQKSAARGRGDRSGPPAEKVSTLLARWTGSAKVQETYKVPKKWPERAYARIVAALEDSAGPVAVGKLRGQKGGFSIDRVGSTLFVNDEPITPTQLAKTFKKVRLSASAVLPRFQDRSVRD